MNNAPRQPTMFPIRVAGRETPDIETSSARYASRFVGPIGAYLLSVQQRGIDSVLTDRRPTNLQSVLDVGGGHGQLAGPLARRGWQVTVIGSDPCCAERVYSDPEAKAISFVAGDLLALPFPDRSFDAVISVRLISHIDDWPRLVAEYCRVARRNVIIDFPTKASINNAFALGSQVKLAIEKTTRTYRSFWPAELQREFAKHGFGLGPSFRQFVLPMAIHRLFGRTGLTRPLEEVLRAAAITSLLGNPIIARFDRLD
jgi:ubiquinone/menaquinone biosynthesis C-methylase UbiE